MTERNNNMNTDVLQFDVMDILRDVIKDCWMILIFSLSVAMCSYIIADVNYKPSYKTNATFVVTSKGANNIYDNLSAANSVAISLTKIFDSDIIKKKVAADIGVNDIPDYISAEVVPETNLLVLSVAAPNPEIAYRIIRSIMENYTSVTSHVYESVILDVLEAPTIPAHPRNSQDISRIMKISLGIGAVFMVIVLGLLSMFRDNIKNEDDINRKLEIKLFGVIYHENKNKTHRNRLKNRKKSILITSPTVSFSFVESIKKIRAKYEYRALLNSGNVLLVTSALENEGKSTIAANLALSLVQKSKKVLLIDADFSKPSIYKIMDKEIKASQDLGAYLQDRAQLKDILLKDENTGLFLVLCGSSCKNSTELVMKEAFKELINVNKKEMDYVIIDSPPISASVDAELLSDISDASLLVVKQSYARAKMINDAIDTLSDTKGKVLGVVYNNVHDNAFVKNKLGYGNKYYYKNYHYYHSANSEISE